jgi:protease II
MSIPKLKKIKSEKKYHDLTLSDEYAWVDQPNILEVLNLTQKLKTTLVEIIKLQKTILKMLKIYKKTYSKR